MEGQGKGPEGTAWDAVATIRQGRAGQGRAGQGRARQGKARHDMLVGQQPGVGRLCWLAALSMSEIFGGFEGPESGTLTCTMQTVLFVYTNYRMGTSLLGILLSYCDGGLIAEQVQSWQLVHRGVMHQSLLH